MTDDELEETFDLARVEFTSWDFGYEKFDWEAGFHRHDGSWETLLPMSDN